MPYHTLEKRVALNDESIQGEMNLLGPLPNDLEKKSRLRQQRPLLTHDGLEEYLNQPLC